MSSKGVKILIRYSLTWGLARLAVAEVIILKGMAPK